MIVWQIKLENIMANKVLLTDADIRYLFQTIGLPKFCARPLIDKLNGVFEEYIDYTQKTEIEEFTKTISSELFRKFWEENLKYFDNVRRVFNLVRHPSRDYIIPSDFEPIFKGKTANPLSKPVRVSRILNHYLFTEILNTHPGLAPLKSAPEYQNRYSKYLVISSIYGNFENSYNSNRGSNNCQNILYSIKVMEE